jgi:carbon-monoxide dehydrogenase small subunit/2-furoyl-CoA dehydrogenase 2Fe-2S iron sulfur subunit
MTNRQVRLTINGREYSGLVEPRKLLTDFLRDDLGLTGTHVGCEHGVCGACTILFNGEPVRSCYLRRSGEWRNNQTIEGLASNIPSLPLQENFGSCTAAVRLHTNISTAEALEEI